MRRSGAISWSRRRILQAAGFSAVTTATLAQLQSAKAQSSDAEVAIEDQETDGTSVEIETAQTEIESRLILISDHQIDGRNVLYRMIELDPGAEFTDRSVELTTPIPETQNIRAEIRTTDGSDELLARDGALVAIGETLDEVDSEDRIRTGPNVELIQANAEAGFHYPYFLYTPELPRNVERPIIVQPNNSQSTDDDYAVHLENAQGVIRGLTSLCDPLKSPGLVPAFPRFHSEPVSWRVMTQSLDPNSLEIDAPPLERIDRQLVRMLEDATDRLESEGYEIADRIHMNGFSQSATFTNRFTILHPEQVRTVTCGGNGFGVLPQAEFEGTTVPYPAGVADLEDLAGKEFDLEAWQTVDQYFFVGDEDQPLPEENPRSYRGFEHLGEEMNELMLDIFGENRVTERFPSLRSAYEAADASAEFTIYEGVGHRTTPEIHDDVVEFHKAHMTVPPAEATEAPELETDERPETDAGDDTPIEDSDADSTSSPEATAVATEDQPGFGVGQTLAVLGGLGYLLRERLSDNE